MANYKRVISYMYAYRNQLKGNNVGFARIETRGNECKITLHIRVVNMKDQEIGGYIYCWYGEELHAVYLGDIHISNGIGELVVKTDVDNVMNSKYRFKDMGGIILYSSDAQYIATEWDGKAVLFDSLKIDTVKPEQLAQIKEHKQRAMEPVQQEKVVAAEAKAAGTIAKREERKEEVEAAVAVVIPPPEPVKVPEKMHTSEVESGLDEMIEDEVAKEEQEEQEEQEEEAEQAEEAEEAEEAEQGVEERPKQEPRQERGREQEQETEEQPDTFPLSREKMEHLDQEAQELFGTMLLNTLFPPDKSAKNRKEEKKEEAFDPLSEESQSLPVTPEEPVEKEQVEKQENVEEKPEEETVHVSETLTVSPKTAIQCFTAFRSCESKKEYEEIQDEIYTMQEEIKQLEHISEEWKIKEARMLEIQREKEELEKEEEKHKIEEKIREEYNIEGIRGELEAAEIKRVVTERIFNKYPRIEPFEGEEVECCVRIEPQDLGIFPMENWILANNSFLLHGYYTYRHLIFVMEKLDGREHYLLGVPGVNHSRERFMANMFGFDTFKNLSSKEDESGEFGYWCQEITM